MSYFDEDEIQGASFDLRLTRRFLGFLRPHRHLIILCAGLILISITAQLLTPWLLKQAIDGPLAQGDREGLARYALLFAGVLVVLTLSEFFAFWLTNLAGQRLLLDLRTSLFRHLQRLPVSYMDHNPVGRLLVRVTTDVENLSELFISGLFGTLGNIVVLVAILAAMFVTDAGLTWITLAASPFVATAALVFRRFARSAYREGRKAIARLNSYLNESVGGVKTIQIFNRQETCTRKFEERNQEYRDRSIHSIFVFSLFWPTIEFLSTATLSVLIVVAAGRISGETLTFGTFLAFWYYLQKFFQPVEDLAEKYNIFQAAMASAERVFKVLDTPVTLTAPAEPKSPPSRGELLFEHVSFSYDGKTPVLRDISFRVRAGEKVAVVGYTGGGKTTLINLLLRLYEVSSGTIRVDGVDVREYDPLDLRRRFGLVQQDVFLFSGSTEDNIRLGEHLTQDQIRSAARTAGAEDFILKLPGQYATPLRERGKAISAGERQLLSIARAIARNPSVLILDEATASVDANTESRVRVALERLMPGRTALLIAHRLSTVREADRILVLHEGRITEEGTHRELVSRGGLYERLCRRQMQLLS